MNNRHFALLICTVFFIASCKKNNQPKIQYTESEYTVNITLDEDLKVHAVEKIAFDYYIFESYTMHYTDSIIKVEKFNQDSSIYNYIYYYVQNDRAQYSIDSAFVYEQLTTIDKGEYSYDDNGYLQEYFEIQEVYNSNDTNYFTINSTESYSYNNGNRTKTTSNILGACDSYFDYSPTEKKMDLEHFLQNYLGTMNKNEISSYTSDCLTFSGLVEIYYLANSEGLITLKNSKFRESEFRISNEIINYTYDFQ